MKASFTTTLAAAAFALGVGCSERGAAAPALVFEPQTGAVHHAHQAGLRWHPASLTKLMTVYLAFEAVEEGRLAFDAPVRMTKNAKAQPFNTLDLPVGSEVPLSEAIPLLLVKSANDMAVAVAETISGSEKAFVAEMNRKAAELGLTDTHFVNPNGIHDPGQYSTARDLAVLAGRLLEDFPDRRPLFALPYVEFRGARMPNHNPLVGSFEGADGMKTGYICESGYNIVASAVRNGRHLVAIVLGALSEKQRAEAARKLLEHGFEAAPTEMTLEGLGDDAAGGAPIDMRPFACAGRSMPPDLVGFGL